MSGTAPAKVILQWRNSERLNLRVVAVAVKHGERKTYVLECRQDAGMDAMGNERWDSAEAETYADELLRKLGESVSQ